MNVHAVLVGIERYDCNADGINLDLDGPASDAVRFAGWMLKRGVPPGNIHLFMNALDMEARKKELLAFPRGGEIKIQSPVRDSIESFFDNDLPALDGGMLYLHWGSHGLIRDGMDRCLFYANIRKDSPLVLNLDRRLAQLRRYGQFADQRIFIDACANPAEATVFAEMAPPQFVSKAVPRVANQEVLFATASGEKAKNDAVRRTGLFSDLLLAEFEKSANWPEVGVMAASLIKEYDRRVKSDPNYKNGPVQWTYKAKDGSGWSEGPAGYSEADDKRERLAVEAYSLLKGLAVSTRNYEKAFRRVDDSASELLELEGMVQSLARQGPLDRCRLFRFLFEVKQLVPMQDGDAIEGWVKPRASANYMVDLQNEIGSARHYRILLSAPDSSKLAWGLRLCNGVVDGHRKERPMTCAKDLLPALEALYDDLIGDLPPDKIDSVEIILPTVHLQRRLEQTGLPIEPPFPKEPLCLTFPVMLRWRNRILQPRYGGRAWKETASYIRTLGAKPKLYKLPQDLTEYWKKKERPAGHVLDLIFESENDAGTELALKLFNGGIPYACWYRDTPPPGYDTSVERFAETIKDFTTFPQQLPGWRQKCQEMEALALFWDDPEQDPAEFITTFKEI